LGFAVLTGPLWVLLILLPLSIWFAVRVSRRFQAGLARRVKGVGIFLAVLFLPFADAIVARAYFGYLCAAEAGPKVFSTVEIGKDYFLSPGETNQNTAGRLPAKGGELNLAKVKEDFEFESKSIKVSRIFRIERDIKHIRDRQTKELLASDTHFTYFGGWLVNAVSPHVSGTTCPAPSDAYFDNFYGSIFKGKT